jgi:hypothetical protein
MQKQNPSLTFNEQISYKISKAIMHDKQYVCVYIYL